MKRFAIYFSPEENSPLGQAALSWLGRTNNAIAEAASQRHRLKYISEKLYSEIIKEPFHYGFHATMKPPFRMQTETQIDELKTALRDFASRQQPFILPPLQISLLNNFFCLRPITKSKDLHKLSCETVSFFDRFRCLPTATELERRRASGLTQVQEEMLNTWGYPYVMDEFRFHLTLTGRIAEESTRSAVCRELKLIFSPEITSDIPLDSLCLFEEINSSPMILLERFYFSR